ncbi:MAG TPA: hypothetical protein VJT83_02260 [Chitinophagaceae bacterium]|nr:hypothetical protein [Chitinophagaceae bacterium]
MKVLCSPDSETPSQVGMYQVRQLREHVYEATLQKFTGNKHIFPGVLVLKWSAGNWNSVPEGYSNIVECLVSELEKWLSGTTAP